MYCRTFSLFKYARTTNFQYNIIIIQLHVHGNKPKSIILFNKINSWKTPVSECIKWFCFNQAVGGPVSVSPRWSQTLQDYMNDFSENFIAPVANDFHFAFAFHWFISRIIHYQTYWSFEIGIIIANQTILTDSEESIASQVRFPSAAFLHFLFFFCLKSNHVIWFNHE